ncbi:MAG TPA: flavin reductase family protein [Pirellulales bacterium]|jgi:flavin reductase (DIM6/NTAB) family NADH-FMN oxidoreductase RutF|nr:flavin reductase family protein [Pirellulales bacterium]
MDFNAAAIDDVFRMVDRPVWVVTAADGERRGGLLATWIAQCSLDPAKPMLLAGLAPHHFTAELVTASRWLAVHLLAAGQAELALNFALGSGRDRDKFAAIGWSSGPGGCPILEDCLGWLAGRAVDGHDTGDRRYFWLEVAAGRRLAAGQPLTEQKLFSAATAEQREQLNRNLMVDIELLRPARDAWLAGS